MVERFNPENFVKVMPLASHLQSYEIRLHIVITLI